jgi:sugar/nucleoside kinase (ribokinase family)
MSLIVTGTIGIDTIHTPHGSAEAVLGGSCTYFAAAAAFFTPVRMVAAVGSDFHDDYRRIFTHFPNISVEGIELRDKSKTFAWGGRYFDDMNSRETLFTELGVVAEKPPVPPQAYRDSRFVFLANTHPAVQADLLSHFPKHELVVADTMNLWIDTARDDLVSLLGKIDGLVLNDEEARLLTGKRNPITAGKKILGMGPKFALIKKGEHGAVLVHEDGIAALPAFPTEVVVDPTGAGDSFAGGLMGHLAASHPVGADTSGVGSLATLQRAMAFGTVVASFTIEQFSLERLTTLTDREVGERMAEFGKVVRVG